MPRQTNEGRTGVGIQPYTAPQVGLQAAPATPGPSPLAQLQGLLQTGLQTAVTVIEAGQEQQRVRDQLLAQEARLAQEERTANAAAIKDNLGTEISLYRIKLNQNPRLSDLEEINSRLSERVSQFPEHADMFVTAFSELDTERKRFESQFETNNENISKKSRDVIKENIGAVVTGIRTKEQWQELNRGYDEWRSQTGGTIDEFVNEVLIGSALKNTGSIEYQDPKTGQPVVFDSAYEALGPQFVTEVSLTGPVTNFKNEWFKQRQDQEAAANKAALSSDINTFKSSYLTSPLSMPKDFLSNVKVTLQEYYGPGREEEANAQYLSTISDVIGEGVRRGDLGPTLQLWSSLSAAEVDPIRPTLYGNQSPQEFWGTLVKNHVGKIRLGLESEIFRNPIYFDENTSQEQKEKLINDKSIRLLERMQTSMGMIPSNLNPENRELITNLMTKEIDSTLKGLKALIPKVSAEEMTKRQNNFLAQNIKSRAGQALELTQQLNTLMSSDYTSDPILKNAANEAVKELRTQMESFPLGAPEEPLDSKQLDALLDNSTWLANPTAIKANPELADNAGLELALMLKDAKVSKLPDRVEAEIVRSLDFPNTKEELISVGQLAWRLQQQVPYAYAQTFRMDNPEDIGRTRAFKAAYLSWYINESPEKLQYTGSDISERLPAIIGSMNPSVIPKRIADNLTEVSQQLSKITGLVQNGDGLASSFIYEGIRGAFGAMPNTPFDDIGVAKVLRGSDPSAKKEQRASDTIRTLFSGQEDILDSLVMRAVYRSQHPDVSLPAAFGMAVQEMKQIQGLKFINNKRINSQTNEPMWTPIMDPYGLLPETQEDLDVLFEGVKAELLDKLKGKEQATIRQSINRMGQTFNPRFSTIDLSVYNNPEVWDVKIDMQTYRQQALDPSGGFPVILVNKTSGLEIPVSNFFPYYLRQDHWDIKELRKEYPKKSVDKPYTKFSITLTP